MIILECNNPDTKKTPAKQAASVCKLSLILSDNSFVQYTHTQMTLSQILLNLKPGFFQVRQGRKRGDWLVILK